MAPRFEFDPTNEVASIPVLPKDDYEFQIGEPSTFMRKNNKGDDSFGIRYPLTVMEGPQKGKRIFLSTYYQSDGGRSMAKQFKMAAYGYQRGQEGERQFDADMQGADWSFNTDDRSIGDAYREMTGKRVRGSLDVQPAKDADGNPTGEQNQNFKAWFPLSPVSV